MLITGCNAGIGFETARSLAAYGAPVPKIILGSGSHRAIPAGRALAGADLSRITMA